MQNLFIVWNDEHNTGIKILDEQHRGLVSLINSFFFHRGDAVKNVDKILVPTADMLKSYAKINFETFETLLRNSNYPKYEECMISHGEILEKVFQMEKKCRITRDADLFLGFLKEYWMRTILSNSAEYIPHLLSYYHQSEMAKHP